MRFAKLFSIGALLGALLLVGPAGAQQPGILGPNQLLGNPTNAGGSPVPVSPPAARGPLLLNIDQQAKPGDANYTILLTDRLVTHTALTAARTDTLPAANALNAGQHILNADLYGVVTGANTVTIQRAGSDTVNGGTSVVLNLVGNSFDCVSDGISAWACTLGARAGSAGITGCINGLSVSGSNCQIVVGQTPGTATNNNATAGNVGEVISSTILSGSAVALTNTTVTNVTSISLTAGDWDVWFNCYRTLQNTVNITVAYCWVNTVSATLPAASASVGYAVWMGSFTSAGGDGPAMAVGPFRQSLAGTTTIFCGVLDTFTNLNDLAYGTCIARRRR